MQNLGGGGLEICDKKYVGLTERRRYLKILKSVARRGFLGTKPIPLKETSLIW